MAELYPEGPSILSELIQNADDAGAKTVKIMYNAKRYGSSSLMGQKMAAWQVSSSSYSVYCMGQLVQTLSKCRLFCIGVFPGSRALFLQRRQLYSPGLSEHRTDWASQ